jgi:hypothetical protein
VVVFQLGGLGGEPVKVRRLDDGISREAEVAVALSSVMTKTMLGLVAEAAAAVAERARRRKPERARRKRSFIGEIDLSRSWAADGLEFNRRAGGGREFDAETSWAAPKGIDTES